MVVELSNFSNVLDLIRSSDSDISLDTETTGLSPYKDSRLFSVIIGTSLGVFYFNYNTEKDCFGKETPHILPRLDTLCDLAEVISKKSTVYMANAKFDMAMLDREVAVTWPDVFDVLVMDRLILSNQMKINLSTVAERYGYTKSEAVEEFIEKHKLYEHVMNPARKKKDKNKFFYKVPFDVIVPYAVRDAEITFQIGRKQKEYLHGFFEQDKRFHKEGYLSPDKLEMHITKILFNMEKRGIHVDRDLCFKRAADHQRTYEQNARRFHDQTRSVLIDSAKVLSPLFIGAGFTPPKTEKEHDSFPDEWLETIDHPLSTLVRGYRTNYKLANTFYKNYIWHLDDNSKIHASTHQTGTRTGRMSYSNPNLQQAPASEVRQVFVAPPDFCCVSIDWDQQEYRMMLDYSEEMDLIREVNNGLDVHTATANLTGVTRKEAKTLNFLLLYGGGVVKLALELMQMTATEPELWYIWKTHNKWRMTAEDAKWKVSPEIYEYNLHFLKQAQGLRDQYFSKLPKVKELIKLCKETAFDRGYIRTWTGRRIYFKPEHCYKAPNALIQGGASDVAKRAMFDIDNRLQNLKTNTVAQIHDEFWFYVHKDELSVVYDLARIMETTFPSTHLPLTTSIEYSWNNFYDLRKLEKGQQIEEAGNQVQRIGH